MGTIAGGVCFVAFMLLGILLLGSLVPAAGGYQIRIVESGSMSPTIPLGAAIVVRPADQYVVDDIVTYQRVEEDAVTTHRIIGVEEGEYVVQGDANNAPDLQSVAAREIVGKVYASIPYLGFILDFIRQPIGFILLIGIPAAWICYEQILRIIREVKNKRETS